MQSLWYMGPYIELGNGTFFYRSQLIFHFVLSTLRPKWACVTQPNWNVRGCHQSLAVFFFYAERIFISFYWKQNFFYLFWKQNVLFESRTFSVRWWWDNKPQFSRKGCVRDNSFIPRTALLSRKRNSSVWKESPKAHPSLLSCNFQHFASPFCHSLFDWERRFLCQKLIIWNVAEFSSCFLFFFSLIDSSCGVEGMRYTRHKCFHSKLTKK